MAGIWHDPMAAMKPKGTSGILATSWLPVCYMYATDMLQIVYMYVTCMYVASMLHVCCMYVACALLSDIVRDVRILEGQRELVRSHKVKLALLLIGLRIFARRLPPRL